MAGRRWKLRSTPGAKAAKPALRAGCPSRATAAWHQIVTSARHAMPRPTANNVESATKHAGGTSSLQLSGSGHEPEEILAIGTCGATGATSATAACDDSAPLGVALFSVRRPPGHSAMSTLSASDTWPLTAQLIDPRHSRLPWRSAPVPCGPLMMVVVVVDVWVLPGSEGRRKRRRRGWRQKQQV